MNRLVIVITLAGGVTASSMGCESEETVASPPGTGGTIGASGNDAGDAGGAGGTGGTSSGGSTQDASWPDVGGAGAGGWAGAQSGGSAGAAGTQAGGSGGATTGGSAGAGGEPCEGQGGSGGPCAFPQGVPDPDFVCWAGAYQDTDPAVDAAVNAVMVELSGCSAGSDCTITGFPGTTVGEICQSWFAAVTGRLREQGFCAGQHIVGHTDEIAVSDTGCTGKWFGYHICNYGGGKVVWNPGARRGWWMIEPSHCPP
jgi:hypothetical protein